VKIKITDKKIYIISLLALLGIISAALRLYINYSTEFMPGAVGAFYIVQVRSIIETGSLAFNEFPLIFYIEAVFAKAIIVFGQTNVDLAVNQAVKIFDGIIPALSIYPAYFLIRKILGEKENKFIVILISSLSVFYVSFFTLISDYQKNSLGLLWLFFLLLYVYKSLLHQKRKNFLLAFIFFALTGVTHFGCFAVALLFLSTLFTVKYFQNFTLKRLTRFTLEVFVVLILGAATIYYFSPDRIELILQIPSEIFHEPILLSILKGKPLISTLDIINIMLVNFIAAAALYFFATQKSSINSIDKIFFFSSIILSFILASPFLGVEWGQRLYLIAYIFTIPLIAFLFNRTERKIIKNVITISVASIISASFLISALTPQFSNMNREWYNELTGMKKYISKSKSTLVIARLGMHYWASWIFRTYIGQPGNVTPEWWTRIDNIYILQQKNGALPFGTAGLYGKPFPEPDVPPKSDLLFEGKYFRLFLTHNPPESIK
jgi:hypothetical protein